MIRKMVGRMLRVCEIDVVAETYTEPILLAVVDLAQPKFVVLDLSAKAPRGRRCSLRYACVHRGQSSWSTGIARMEQGAMDAGAAVS